MASIVAHVHMVCMCGVNSDCISFLSSNVMFVFEIFPECDLYVQFCPYLS